MGEAWSEPKTRTNASAPFGVIVPVLEYPDVRGAVEWLCRAFGFSERLRVGNHRAQLRFGWESVVVSAAPAGATVLPASHSLLVRVANVDAHHANSVRHGALVVSPPADQPYGEREYVADDLAGHRWTFSQTIANVDPAVWGGEVVVTQPKAPPSKAQASKLLDDIFRRETPGKEAGYIARLDRWLVANRPDYHAHLRPGASDADLDEFEQHFRLKLPESFRAFYRWRDGQEEGCTAGIMDDFRFLSLAAISGRKELLDGGTGRGSTPIGWWRREWVPFLENGNGDHPCLDLTQSGEGLAPQVRRFWKSSPDRSIWFGKFESWIAVLVESMETGRHFTMKPKPTEPGSVSST